MSRGSEKRARDRPITVRLTADERAKVQQDAARAGLMTGSYVRRTLLSAEPPRQMRRPSVERQELVRLLGQLGHIGSNLNQIAREIHQGDGIDRIGLAEDISNLRRVRDAILAALGRAP